VVAVPIILAHAVDGRLRASLESRLQALPGDPVILLATAALAEAPDEALIGDALSAWSDGELLIVSIGGALPPLGLRDVERLDWTPGTNDDRLIAAVAAHFEPPPAVAMPMAPASREAEPRVAAPPPPARLAITRGLVLAALLVIGSGLVGLVAIGEFRRSAVPERTALPPPPSPASTPSAPPMPVFAPSPAPPPAPPPSGPSRPAGDPALDVPSGTGGGARPPEPAKPPASEASAGLDEWLSVALWLVPALLALLLVTRLLRRKRRSEATGAPGAREPEMAAFTPAEPATSIGAGPTPAPANGPRRIFVSYSHQDIARVDPIIEEIERLGHPVWIDRRELSGGPGWAGQIVRALRGARSVVLMASRNAYASDQVVREMYLAMSEKKPIVPLELETAEIPDELQYILAPFQRHRLDGGDQARIINTALAAL
jgi:hypothetical protein